MINISSPEFQIWQHLEDQLKGTQLHHLVNIPSVPIDQLYKHMVSSTETITPFMTTDESIDHTASIWKLFSHTGIYTMAIGSLIPAGLGIFFCYFFWCQPARLVHWPLQSGSMWYTIVDHNVGAAPIYRCNGKAGPSETRGLIWNGNLHGQRVNRNNKHSQKQFLHLDHWTQLPKSGNVINAHMVCCQA